MDASPDTAGSPEPESARTDAIARHGRAMQEFMARAVLFQDAVARAVGLNSTDLQTIGILMSGGPLTPGQLAAEVGLTSGGAITAVIDRLERAGHVTRSRDPEDRRRVVVTAEPTSLMPRIAPVYRRISERWGEYLETLTDEQLSFATEFLERAAALNVEQTRELRAPIS
ncbi:MarR family winged helix-turn-helix transcriptional regulator [Microbacterium hydrocarbonoxydans]|uniref:MarR family winged helix-turn-helix transcriptional regulator n=1 Tax=Microbacterium hydrocarbonoxydans TaxID=273678 RepID=UPI0007BB705E|nr:MarR family transcriptional regulator [Microbacterium hydrocarbonoxydans]GAT73635.1 transcriptional regulator, MarR family [Microbacterium sp. HM58-2]